MIPAIPLMKMRGRKTASVVSVLATMAAATSLLPCFAASKGATPDSLRRCTFSMTTIALSTSIPTPSASPPSVMMFSVQPAKYIRAKVETMETGIAIPMMPVLLMSRRKKRSTSIASIPPKTPEVHTFVIERSM